MVSIRRFRFVFPVTILLVFIMGCEEDGGDKGVLEPLSGEPMILEAVMCLAIDDGRPQEITDTFLDSDDSIFLWMYWSNVPTESEVEVLWFEPGNELALVRDSQTIISTTGFAITWFSIDEPLFGFEDGEWSVDIYLDDLFERSHLFTILND